MIGPRPDAAPTIVMLHEGLGCVGLWGAFPEQLASATGAGVFVYSRAGYGRSSPGKLPRSINFMDEEAREVLPRVLAAIGFQRGILFGHSDGGLDRDHLCRQRTGSSRPRSGAHGAAFFHRGDGPRCDPPHPG